MTSPSPLRFLADESCDIAVVYALRDDGYDVLALSEVTRHTVDTDVIAQATQERRVLLTEDKDFGWLVFVSHVESAGVILMRFPGNVRRGMVEAVRRVVQVHGIQLVGAFVVVRPGLVRINRKPPGQGRQ